MTYQETLNQFLILGAALCKHVPTNDLEISQQNVVKDEILYNIEFTTAMKNLFNKNFVFEGEQGCVPTIKGWKSLQPQVKVVERPFNRARIPQGELVPMTLSLLEEICYRKQAHPNFFPIWKENSSRLDDAFNCVFKKENKALGNEFSEAVKALGDRPRTPVSDVAKEVVQQEVETPVEESKGVKTSKKKVKQELVEQVE